MAEVREKKQHRTQGEGKGEAGFPLDLQLPLPPHLQRLLGPPSLGRVYLTKERDVLKALVNRGEVCVGLGGAALEAYLGHPEQLLWAPPQQGREASGAVRSP